MSNYYCPIIKLGIGLLIFSGSSFLISCWGYWKGFDKDVVGTLGFAGIIFGIMGFIIILWYFSIKIPGN